VIRLESLNVGAAKPLVIGNEVVRSGIRKAPVAEADLGVHGFGGDEQADLNNHGGPDQAVYLYRSEDYAWWAERLGRALEPGTLGENMLVSGLPELLRIGDRLEVSEVLLELTAARIPCNKLAARMGDHGFVKTFRAAERPGAYARVLRPGRVRVGDTLSYGPTHDGAPTVLESFRWYYDKNPDADALRRALEAPLGARMRGHLERKLSGR
jgi:MOSC domain-containing protein YiiM